MIVKISMKHLDVFSKDQVGEMRVRAIASLTPLTRIFASVQMCSRYSLPVITWKPNPRYAELAFLSKECLKILRRCRIYHANTGPQEEVAAVINPDNGIEQMPVVLVDNYDYELLKEKFDELCQTKKIIVTRKDSFSPQSWEASASYDCVFTLNGVEFPKAQAKSEEDLNNQIALLAVVELASFSIFSRIEPKSAAQSQKKIILDRETAKSVNSSQASAIERILDPAELLTLVQGPPGM